MQILVTGATGFLGRALVSALAAAGDDVVALSRDPAGARARLPEVQAAHAWEPLEGPPPGEAFAGVDAVVHLAAEPVDGRWTDEKRRAIRDTRVLGTRNLVDGLLAADPRPRVLVAASGVGIYGDRGDEELDETSTLGEGFLPEVARAWEDEALRATGEATRVVTVRSGIVLGRTGGALPRLLTPAKLAVSGPLGGGRQWWPWIHLEDEIGILRHALATDDLRGPLNAGSPAPVRQREFAKALGRAVHRPAVLPAPAFALKLVLGGFSSELLTSHRVLPAKAEATGYRFVHPALDTALDDLVG